MVINLLQKTRTQIYLCGGNIVDRISKMKEIEKSQLNTELFHRCCDCCDEQFAIRKYFAIPLEWYSASNHNCYGCSHVIRWNGKKTLISFQFSRLDYILPFAFFRWCSNVERTTYGVSHTHMLVRGIYSQ